MVKVEFNSTFLNPGFSNVICILSYRYLSGFFKGAFFLCGIPIWSEGSWFVSGPRASQLLKIVTGQEKEVVFSEEIVLFFAILGAGVVERCSPLRERNKEPLFFTFGKG